MLERRWLYYPGAFWLLLICQEDYKHIMTSKKISDNIVRMSEDSRKVWRKIFKAPDAQKMMTSHYIPIEEAPCRRLYWDPEEKP